MDVIEGIITREGLFDGFNNSCNSEMSRYTLCNLSQYAELPLCNKSSGMGNITADYSHLYAMQRFLSIVVPIIFGIIVFVGLIGNALVVVVVAANQQVLPTFCWLVN